MVGGFLSGCDAQLALDVYPFHTLKKARKAETTYRQHACRDGSRNNERDCSSSVYPIGLTVRMSLGAGQANWWTLGKRFSYR